MNEVIELVCVNGHKGPMEFVATYGHKHIYNATYSSSETIEALAKKYNGEVIGHFMCPSHSLVRFAGEDDAIEFDMALNA